MTMRTFLGVTVHFLEGTEIKSVEIGLKHIRDAKSIVNLRRALREICEEWSIDKHKVQGVVTDNGANIKGACKAEFGDEKHLSCFAHIINWIGQNAVSSTPIPVGDERQAAAATTEENEREVDEDEGDSEDDGGEDDHNYSTTATVTDLNRLFAKMRKIIKFFRCSERASTELKNLQMSEWKKAENECLKLIQEVRTRWNSYYESDERFLYLSDFVSRVLLKCQREKHTTKSKVPDFLTGDELAVLSEVKTLLRPLWQVTKEMSSEKAVTLSKCIPIVQSLKTKIEQFPASHAIVFNLKLKLLDAIKERFGRLEEVRPYAIATILDPRFKKFAFEKPQHAASAICTVGKLVQQKLNSTLQEHAQRQQDQEQPPKERDPDDLWADLDSRIAEQSALLSNQDTPGGLPVELRQYLNMPTSSRTCDPFKEWEHLKQRLPHVYEVARDVLPVLSTSVPSERLFSHAGQIATKLRNRLSAAHLQMYCSFLPSTKRRGFRRYLIELKTGNRTIVPTYVSDFKFLIL